MKMHNAFYEWILEKREVWELQGIEIEKINDLRNGRPYTDLPYVGVAHKSAQGLGEIHLFEVRGGYIIEFHAGLLEIDENLVYIHEFSENPQFDLWQERYVALLTK